MVATTKPHLSENWFDGFYRPRLDELNRDLSGLVDCTENQFLAIGARLRDFHTQASEVSTQAVQAYEILTGEKSEEIRNRLQFLLEGLDLHLKQAMQRAERGNHILTSLLERLEDLPESLANYRGISKTLRFLGISTLIESSDLKSAEGFQNLGDALRELQHAMLAKVDKISLRIESLATLCRSVSNEVAVHDSSRSSLKEQSDELTRSLLAAAAQRNLIVAKTTQTLVQRSDRVTSGIGEIVSSMQYHDITRQQIDHVRTALANLGTGLGEAAHQEPLDRQTAQIQVLDETCRLQAAHLRHANDELNAAVERIITSLHGISEAVTETAADIQLAAGNVEHDGTSVFIELDAALTKVSEALVREITTSQKTEQAIAAVFNEAAQMVELIEEINQIGVEMKVIALNAGINAFHSSGNNPALTVTASGIQHLAERVFSQTKSLETNFASLIEVAQSLNDSSDPGLEHPAEQTLDLSQEAAELLWQLRQLSGKSVERLNGMKSLSKGLAEEIERAINAVTVHKTAPRIVEQVVQGLGEISKRVGKLPRSHEKPADDSYLLSLREQYTMQSEREIYSTLRDKESDQGEERDNSDAQPAEPYDNVEFF
jgi:hypothetical protein